MQAAGRGKPRSPSAAFATLAAVVLAALALAAPASAAPPAIGGFSGGHSEPIPPGAPRIPYSADFLKGSPTVKGLRLRELVGGPRAGRLRVRVAVNYPELRQRPTGLLSDRASYDGRVIVVFKRVGFDVRERETQAVPLGARRQGGRVVQRAVLSARASRVLQADGGRIAARVRAIGSFDQFGDGQAEERAAGQLRRSVRIGQAHRRPGSGDETAFACAGDADLNAYKPGREPFFDAHLIYQGQEDVFFDQPSLRIRLCVW